MIAEKSSVTEKEWQRDSKPRHPRTVDVEGQRFGRLVALFPTAERINRNVVWEWQCDCGSKAHLTLNRVRFGGAQSCGCLQRETSRQRMIAVIRPIRQAQQQVQVNNGQAQCRQCKNWFDVAEFRPHRSQPRKTRECALCRGCIRNNRHFKVFRLTPDNEHKIDDFQGHRCAICEKPFSICKSNTDHRHSDGLIRGKLCWQCNHMLGRLRDNAVLFRRAANYLENPPAVRALGRPLYGLPGRIGTKKSRALAKKLVQWDGSIPADVYLNAQKTN
jgi:hypothetical protein